MSVNEKLEKIIQGRREQYRHWKFCLTSFSNSSQLSQVCAYTPLPTPLLHPLKAGMRERYATVSGKWRRETSVLPPICYYL